MGSEVESTLFVHKEVDLFKIPPRMGASGHRSGEWKVADKIFTARLKVVAQGEKLEVRLEDPNSGELFGVCPVPRGQLHIAVEAATDSSRNFVLRLEDAATKRHAFIGMSFADRSAAFDFNVSLTDHEKRLQREAEFSKIAAAADPLAAAEQVLPEAAAMYRHQDLSLKEGETIRIAVKKPGSAGAAEGAAGSGGFLSRLGHLPHPSTGASEAGASGKLMPLAPPPADVAAGGGRPGSGGARLAPPPAAAAAAPRPATADPFASMPASSSNSSGAARSGGGGQVAAGGRELMGLDFFNLGAGSSASAAGGSSGGASAQSALAAFESFQPFAAPSAAQQQPAPKPPAQQPAAEPGWATFE